MVELNADKEPGSREGKVSGLALLSAYVDGFRAVKLVAVEDWSAQRELEDKPQGWELGDWLVTVDGEELAYQCTDYYCQLLASIQTICPEPLDNIDQDTCMVDLPDDVRQEIESAVSSISMWSSYLPVMLRWILSSLQFVILLHPEYEFCDGTRLIPPIEVLCATKEYGAHSPVTVGSLRDACNAVISATSLFPERGETSVEGIIYLMDAVVQNIQAIGHLIAVSVGCYHEIWRQSWQERMRESATQ